MSSGCGCGSKNSSNTPIPEARVIPKESTINVPDVFKNGLDSVTGFKDNVDLANRISRLYIAAFERFSDADGLQYWFNISQETDINSVANAFINSKEFRDTYGELNDLEFIDELYQNVLGRNLDAAGRDYWNGLLETGSVGREQILVGISDSAENQALFNSLF